MKLDFLLAMENMIYALHLTKIVEKMTCEVKALE